MKFNKKGKQYSLFIFSMDFLLVCAIIGIFIMNGIYNGKKLRQQNLADIVNLNKASANFTSSFLIS